jgi:microcystin-dependent protein
MANTIRPKRSYTAAAVPTAVIAGEMSVNVTDGKIWMTSSDGLSQVLVSSLTRSDHTGTLGVANGGTGATTLTANNVILGNGTSTPSFVAPGTSGNLLTSNGTTWQSSTPAAATGLPTGALMPYAGATAPTGYLLCDGSSVSSSTYLALHAVISNTYGGSAYTGAGGLSFNLPDLKGRMPIGSMGTGSGLTARVTGTKYGTESHTVSSSNISQFTTGNMNANVNHSHAPSGGSLFWVYNAAGANSVPNSAPQVFKIGADASTATTASTNLEHQHTVGSASPTAINHLPPTIGLNYIIKT